MEDYNNRDAGQGSRNPQDQDWQNSNSQRNSDDNEVMNADRATDKTASQRSGDYDRQGDATRSDSGNYSQNNQGSGYGNNASDNDTDDEGNDNQIPNPEDFDEGDSYDTEDNERDATRTPGL